MKHAMIALVHPPKEDRQQVGEMTLRSFGLLVNRERKGNDRVLVSVVFVEDPSELRGVPDVTMIIACGLHEVNEQKEGIHYYRSIHDMESGVVEVLQRRFPVTPAHPELKLAHGDGDNGPVHEKSESASTRPLKSTFQNEGDGPTCRVCGHVAVRNGACYTCLNCGESIGCS